VLSRSVAATAVGCALALTATGCGGKSVVSQQTVESQVASRLAAEANQPTPTVSCPGDLTAKVGATMTCVLTPDGAAASYNVEVTVNSVSDGTAHFGVRVASTPNP
jgi:D-tyrosyl-tRNA(Tyr) deacylase